MDVDWQRIFHKDLVEKNPFIASSSASCSYSLHRSSTEESDGHKIPRENLMITRPWTTASTRAPQMILPKPLLSSTSSLHDFDDYFHVFDDDDEVDGSEEMKSQSTQGSHQLSSSASLPQLLSEQDHHEMGHRQYLHLQKMNENSPTRYIYNSERINSTQPSSPLNSVGTQWTIQAVEQIMKNPTDPIGKVITLNSSPRI
jgi:hypothetical protein